MGAGNTKGAAANDQTKKKQGTIQTLDELYPPLPIKVQLALTTEMHHFMPSNLPMFPIMNSGYLSDANRTWKLICTANTDKMKGYGKQGIVLFYDEFFHRLFQRDSQIQKVFPSIKKRSEILISVMTFMLKTSTEDPILIAHRSKRVGIAHKAYPHVEPHHFSVFVTTMIEVIMYWLGENATPDSGEAWSNVVGFYLKHVLSAYLPSKVDYRHKMTNFNTEDTKVAPS